MDIPRQHAFITGGTGCLGREIAKALRDSDWLVTTTGTADLDLREPAAVHEYFRNIEVDLLVCAAGITKDAPIARLSEEAWDETWAVNFTGSRECARAVLPGMIRRGVGHIVFISSYSALHPPIGQAAYASAKSSLLGLVDDLACAHGSSNIRVNAILPGFLETRMTETVSQSRCGEILAEHALGRFNTCEHTARFIRFLHDNLPHTSGQVFQLDSR